MSKVAEYMAAGYIVENPENADEVIYAPPIRILKTDVETGCFEITAATEGWTPASGVSALKNYANQKMEIGVKMLMDKQAAEAYQNWLASRA